MPVKPPASWIDALTQGIAPRWTLKRQRARMAADFLVRHYEAAGFGRRTQNWRGGGTDANAAIGPGLKRLREQARDLVRNNPYAGSALDTIVDHVVGWGITAAPKKDAAPALRNRATDLWKAWAETTACDADGRLNFAGIQKLAVREVFETGEVLIRRRFRRPSDGLPIPLQLQVLEGDYLDIMKTGAGISEGSEIIQGVEFDAIGRRTAYWLYPYHPGSLLGNISISGIGNFGGSSRPIPASEILHIFPVKRAGQVRGASAFANVILRMKDFDEYEDATLMKQKIASCLAVLTTDVDGTSPGLGAVDPENPVIDSLEPGWIGNLPPGRSVTVVEPPSVAEHPSFTRTVLHAIATGLGVTYEDLTGDYQNLPFSAARMSRIRHWARVNDWRWQMLVPQLCDPVWQWAMQAAVIMGLPEAPPAIWTAPAMPMIEPDKEGLAYQRNIRSGITTLSESIRERGYDPDDLLQEAAEDNKKIDALGLILDSDARKTTQQGGPRDPSPKPQAPAPAAPPKAAVPANANGNRNGHHDKDGFALLAEVRAHADQIAEVVTRRLDEAPNPELRALSGQVAELLQRLDERPTHDVPAPAPAPPTSIHINVNAPEEPEADTITTPVYAADGSIAYTVKTRAKAEAPA